MRSKFYILEFCDAYLVEVESLTKKHLSFSLLQVVKAASNGYELNTRLYSFLVFVLLVPFVFVRKLTHLAPFSMFANVLTVLGLIITVQYCFHDLPATSDYPAFTSWGQLPLYFGIAIYAFEGIGVVSISHNCIADVCHLASLLRTKNGFLPFVSIWVLPFVPM